MGLRRKASQRGSLSRGGRTLIFRGLGLQLPAPKRRRRRRR